VSYILVVFHVLFVTIRGYIIFFIKFHLFIYKKAQKLVQQRLVSLTNLLLNIKVFFLQMTQFYSAYSLLILCKNIENNEIKDFNF